ncbi:MAG: beta-galactosidase [Candidatus Omnitrophica bacterium]|nr:beta-galactosidase [Candidatus Omnitrophota bacterium]
MVMKLINKKIFFLILFFCFSGYCHRFDQKISYEFVSPHTKWASPYYKGPIKILVICPLFAQREVVELGQRIESFCNSIGILEKGGFFSEDDITNTFLKIKYELEKNWDVLIIGSVNWKNFPKEIKDKILDKIFSGTGAIFVDPQGIDEKLFEIFEDKKLIEESIGICQGFPFKFLPVFNRFSNLSDFTKRYVNLSLYGEGRIVVLNYPSGRETYRKHLFLTPYLSGLNINWIDYDYYFSLIGKLIVWVAKKEPEIRIKEINKKENLFNIILSDITKQDFLLVYQGKDREGEIRNTGKIKIEKQKKEFNLNLSFPSNIYFVDFFLISNDGKIVDWYSVILETKKVIDTKISFSKEFFKSKEPIEGEIEFNKLSENIKIEKVKISLLDNSNKLIEEKIYNWSEKIKFSFLEKNNSSYTHKIKIEVFSNKDFLNEEIFYILTPPERNYKNFIFIVAGENDNTYIIKLIREKLKKEGVDVWWSYYDEKTLFNTLNDNLQVYPYVFSIKAYSTPDRLIRQPSLTDPQYIKNMKESLVKQAKLYYKYLPIAWGLGDENEISHWSKNDDLDFSSSCLDDLRDYLKKEYLSLEKLNQQWQTDFKNWTEVKPFTLQELLKKGEKTNFSSWIDHRLHMETVFANIHKIGLDSIKEIDEDGKVGPEGCWEPDNSFTGYDYYKIGTSVNCIGAYGCLSIWRSFLSNDTFLFQWGTYGGPFGDRVNRAKYWPWKVLFSGGNGIAWFCAFGDIYSALNPDLTLADDFSALVKEVKEIKTGIDKLLFNSKRIDQGIRIHYSQVSMHLNTALNKIFTCPNVHSSRLAIEDALRKLGFDPFYISSQQIEEGGLKKVKVIFLPVSLCISEKETVQIKEFVENGGILIADCFPGIADGHGKILEKNKILMEIFGIKDRKRINSVDTASKLKVKLPEEEILLDVYVSENLTFEPNVSYLGFTEKGEKGIFINRFGKGKAVLLNFPFYDYPSEQKTTFYNFLVKLLTLCNIFPEYKISKDNKNVFGVEITLFENKGNKILCLLRDHHCSENLFDLRLPESYYVYDLRENKLLGNMKEIKLEFTDSPAKIFLLSKEKEFNKEEI